jgi:hypothetical protein
MDSSAAFEDNNALFHSDFKSHILFIHFFAGCTGVFLSVLMQIIIGVAKDSENIQEIRPIFIVKNLLVLSMLNSGRYVFIGAFYFLK